MCFKFLRLFKSKNTEVATPLTTEQEVQHQIEAVKTVMRQAAERGELFDRPEPTTVLTRRKSI